MSTEDRQQVFETTPLKENEEDQESLQEQPNEDHFVEPDTDSLPKASFASAVFNLTNTIIGGGVLALPYSLMKTGILLGSIILASVGILCCISAHMICKASSLSKNQTYRKVAVHCFGRKGGFTVDASLVLFSLGACIGYTVIIGDIATPYMVDAATLGPNYNHEAWRALVMGIVTLLILFPLCILKRIDSLRWTSMIAIVCITYLVLIIIIRSCIYLTNTGINHQELRIFRWTSDIFTILPIIGFAFAFHMQIFPIMNEMKNQNQINSAINLSVIICSFTYIAVGLFGYLSFYNQTQDNILNNYGDNDLFIDIGKGSLFFIICFSYPLLAYPARTVIDESFVQQPTPNWRRWTEAAVFCIITFVSAVAVPGISFVFGIVGASAGNMVVYILPSLLYLWILYEIESQNGEWQRPDQFWKSIYWFFSWKKMGALFILIFGILCGIISLIVIVVDVL